MKKFFDVEPQVCAVCVPDGAKLIVQGIPQQLQEAHGLNANEAVIFRQLSLEVHTYRDAVEFKNGVRVRLQELEEGQRIAVLALSPEEAEVRTNLRAAHA